jgi:hypothetical protein
MVPHTKFHATVLLHWLKNHLQEPGSDAGGCDDGCATIPEHTYTDEDENPPKNVWDLLTVAEQQVASAGSVKLVA